VARNKVYLKAGDIEVPGRGGGVSLSVELLLTF
jgi:hypothetical protein